MWTIPSLSEGHLHALMDKFPDFVKEVMKKHIMPFISSKNKGIELDNASISILGPKNQRWKIISGHGKYPINVELTDINYPVITIKTEENKPEEIHCGVITKAFLETCILQKCGKEGATTNESMRQLLQVAIDRLYTGEYDTSKFKNAKIYIYDSMATLILVSGDGRHSFVINFENGSPQLRPTNNIHVIDVKPWFSFPSFQLTPSHHKALKDSDH